MRGGGMESRHDKVGKDADAQVYTCSTIANPRSIVSVLPRSKGNKNTATSVRTGNDDNRVGNIGEPGARKVSAAHGNIVLGELSDYPVWSDVLFWE